MRVRSSNHRVPRSLYKTGFSPAAQIPSIIMTRGCTIQFYIAGGSHHDPLKPPSHLFCSSRSPYRSLIHAAGFNDQLRSARRNDGSSGCRAAFCRAHAHGWGPTCNAPQSAPDLSCKGQKFSGGQRMAAHATRVVAQYFYSRESRWPQSLESCWLQSLLP